MRMIQGNFVAMLIFSVRGSGSFNFTRCPCFAASMRTPSFIVSGAEAKDAIIADDDATHESAADGRTEEN